MAMRMGNRIQYKGKFNSMLLMFVNGTVIKL